MAYSGSNTIHASINWNPAYDAYKHVAMWGNDTLGDGTKTKPYRTIGKAMSNATVLNVVIGAGTYRESIFTPASTGAWNLVADGNVIIDVSNNSLFSTSSSFTNAVITGIYFRGSGNFVAASTAEPTIAFTSCTFEGCHFALKYAGSQTYCTYLNAPNIQSGTSGCYGSFTYCTFFASNMAFNVRGNLFTKCIFSTCIILWSTDINSPWAGFTYINLYNTSQKFPGQSVFTNYSDTTTLKAALTALSNPASFPTTVVNNLFYVDPLFNNSAHLDVSIALTSPCKNMAYDGTIIGSKPIGINFAASTNATSSAFDNASLVNMTIDPTTAALTMTNTALLAQATLKPFANLFGRNFQYLPNYGFFSDRSGQYIDATPDMDLTGVYSAGDALTDGRIYIVDGSGGQIIYGGTTLAVGDRFTCKSATATVFTNVSVAGYVREIIEAPTRQNIEARFSNGTGTFKANGDILTTGSWYHLSAGSAVLSGVTYNAALQTNPIQTYIKGDGTAITLTGATLEEVFTAADPYLYYESFGQVTCNRTGNVITGSITKGNGDPSFDRTTGNIFKISSKHCQTRYTMQPSNLIP